VYEELAKSVPTFAFVVFPGTPICPLVGPDQVTTYPETGEAPELRGASQFKDTVFVETPVTFKFWI